MFVQVNGREIEVIASEQSRVKCVAFFALFPSSDDEDVPP